MMKLIDPDLLRTFIAFVDAGSLARAAHLVGRSPSAVTAQMQRLERLVGEPLLVSAGRGRHLSPAGEEFVVHARRILDAHRDAWRALAGLRAEGRVALAATEDFCEDVLPCVLRDFVRAYPRVRVDVRIGRSAELVRAVEEGAADVALAWRTPTRAQEVGVFFEPMLWRGAADIRFGPADDAPLAALDAPCGFRAAAVAALESAGRPFRIAATSASLSGLRAAVVSGMAVTPRTARWRGQGVVDVAARLRLPDLPEAAFAISLRRDADRVAGAVADALREALHAGSPPPARTPRSRRAT